MTDVRVRQSPTTVTLRPLLSGWPLLLVLGDAGEHVVHVLRRAEEDGRPLVDRLRLDVQDADRAVARLAAGLRTSHQVSGAGVNDIRPSQRSHTDTVGRVQTAEHIVR